MSYALGSWAERKALEVAESERTAFALKLIKRGRPIEEIIEDTGLSKDKVESLQTSSKDGEPTSAFAT